MKVPGREHDVRPERFRGRREGEPETRTREHAAGHRRESLFDRNARIHQPADRSSLPAAEDPHGPASGGPVVCEPHRHVLGPAAREVVHHHEDALGRRLVGSASEGASRGEGRVSRHAREDATTFRFPHHTGGAAPLVDAGRTVHPEVQLALVRHAVMGGV